MPSLRSHAVLAAVLACAASLPGLDVPDLTVPGTLGIQIKTSDPAEMEQIAKLGVRIMRRGFYWDTIETQKGVYDFSSYDVVVDKAEALGVRLIGCLFANGKKLYEPSAPHQGRAIQTEAGRQGFAAWAAACAARYKGRSIHWEIWNEPNVQTFWRKGTHNSEAFADEYSRLVLATAPAMLAADPGCFIMAGSVSNYWEPVYAWTEHCFKRGVLGSGIRAWSVHPYGVKTPEEHAAGGGGGHERMRALMRTHNNGVELPLINSERGFSVSKTEEGWSGGSLERALEFQAWHLVRQYMVDLMTGVRGTIWYEWGGDQFGLMSKDGTPRPAHRACETLVARLGGFAYAERIDAGSPQDYLLSFRHPDGRRMLVAWTAPPPGKAPDAYAEHSVALPAAAAAATATVSVLGVESPLPSEDGRPVLRLSGAPQYVAY